MTSAVSVSCCQERLRPSRGPWGGMDTAEVWASVRQVMGLSWRIVTCPTEAAQMGFFLASHRGGLGGGRSNSPRRASPPNRRLGGGLLLGRKERGPYGCSVCPAFVMNEVHRVAIWIRWRPSRVLYGSVQGFVSPTGDLGETLGHWDLVRKTLMISHHMSSGSFLVRKVLVQNSNDLLNFPELCAVQISFE